MGQKTHPYGFRLVYNKSWKSRWYADKDYARLLHEDLDLRARLKSRFEVELHLPIVDVEGLDADGWCVVYQKKNGQVCNHRFRQERGRGGVRDRAMRSFAGAGDVKTDIAF